MSNSVRPQRQQPTRLPRPWDSPGKNTGVGCHFLLQCMKMKSESEVAQSCPTLLDPMDCAYQAPPSMVFSRQEYWSGVSLPSPCCCLVTSKCSWQVPICSSSSVSHSVVSNSLQPHGLWAARLLCPWDSPGKNTGVDCHCLIQRIFLTQESNLGLLHCRQILYHLSYREDQPICS